MTRSTEPGGASEVSDPMDTLVEQASVPNLAALFEKGIEQGVLQPTYSYTAGDTGSNKYTRSA